MELFRANLIVSVGGNHHPSQVRRTFTYTEEEYPCHGETFEGNYTTAVAGPGGYYKRITSQGRDWSAAIAVGGSHSPSIARAGPDSVDGYAGGGGHAVAAYGRDKNFHATIYGPRGEISTKHWDGSTSRRQTNREMPERISYPEKQRGRIMNGDEDEGAARYGDERHGGVMYGEKKKKKKKQKAIDW